LNISKFITGIVIAAMLFPGGSVPLYAANEPAGAEPASEKSNLLNSTTVERHWVYNELAAFKQLMLPVILSNSTTEKNKNVLKQYIFNEAQLDEAILIDHWAFLLGEVLQLPIEKKDQLLAMYAYGLSTGDGIKREDAVGGLFKLLTFDFLSGQISAAELEPANVLKDVDSISERQRVLVRKVYCEGILDATVKDMFRPGDPLMVAEAVSMLYRVMEKYDIDLSDTVNKNDALNPQQHWADREFETAINEVNEKAERIKGVQQIIRKTGADGSVSLLDSAITIDKWNELLLYILELEKTKYEKDFLEAYTYGLTRDKYITRASAAAGMVKLLHAAELVEWRDATEEEKAAAASYFTDYAKVWDQSKFSIAFAEGLIKGYENCSFRPEQPLTNGEALALMLRIIDKYN